MANPVGSGTVNPAPHHVHQQQKHSVLIETITIIALSVLCLVAAHACDYSAPGVAILLRCIPIGLSLIWLLNRCLPKSSSGNHYVSASPYFWQPSYYHHWSLPTWGKPWMWKVPFTHHHHHTPYHPPQVVHVQHPPVVIIINNLRMFHHVQHPAVVHHHQQPTHVIHTQHVKPFPIVQPAPAQPGVHHHQAGHGSFPAVKPAPAQPGMFKPMQQGFGPPSAGLHRGMVL